MKTRKTKRKSSKSKQPPTLSFRPGDGEKMWQEISPHLLAILERHVRAVVGAFDTQVQHVNRRVDVISALVQNQPGNFEVNNRLGQLENQIAGVFRKFNALKMAV